MQAARSRNPILLLRLSKKQNSLKLNELTLCSDSSNRAIRVQPLCNSSQKNISLRIMHGLPNL